jgi:hypothetical protein
MNYKNSDGDIARRYKNIITPGGDRGIQTLDLSNANAALYQLSYIPTASSIQAQTSGRINQ